MPSPANTSVASAVKKTTARNGRMGQPSTFCQQPVFSLRFSRPVLQKRTQTVATAGVAQLPEGFGFNLPDALAGYGEVLAHFLERVLAAVFQAEPHFDDLFLARRK